MWHLRNFPRSLPRYPCQHKRPQLFSRPCLRHNCRGDVFHGQNPEDTLTLTSMSVKVKNIKPWEKKTHFENTIWIPSQKIYIHKNISPVPHYLSLTLHHHINYRSSFQISLPPFRFRDSRAWSPMLCHMQNLMIPVYNTGYSKAVGFDVSYLHLSSYITSTPRYKIPAAVPEASSLHFNTSRNHQPNLQDITPQISRTNSWPKSLPSVSVYGF